MTWVFKKLVKSDMVVIDVGANIGYYSLLASKLVGDKGEVIAFEPERDNFDRLFGNCLLNRIENVFVSNMAVSDQKGQSVLYVSNRESGEHTLVPNPKFAKRKVQTVALDSLFSHYHHVDIVKSDTEGHEIEVLAGAFDIIQRNLNIKMFVEFNAMVMDEVRQERLWNMLCNLGFKYLYLLDDFSGQALLSTLGTVKQYCKSHKKSANILCSRSMADGI
jgi:FkbM family methyltransferase